MIGRLWNRYRERRRLHEERREAWRSADEVDASGATLFQRRARAAILGVLAELGLEAESVGVQGVQESYVHGYFGTPRWEFWVYLDGGQVNAPDGAVAVQLEYADARTPDELIQGLVQGLRVAVQEATRTRQAG
jgi:hypothetical protein